MGRKRVKIADENQNLDASKVDTNLFSVANIGIKWKLIFICVLLVSIPSSFIGYLSYQIHREESELSIEDNLENVVEGWKEAINLFVTQKEYLREKEENQLEHQLEIVANNVKKIFQIESSFVGGNISDENLKIIYDEISEISIGRNGYVAIFDMNGRYVLSQNRERDGESVIDARDINGNYFVRDSIEQLPNVIGNHSIVHDYYWRNDPDSELVLKKAVAVYYEPLEIIIAATASVSDNVDVFYDDLLLEEMKQEMADEVIGINGYIWVIHDDGHYVLSKDRLRDGEYIWDTIDHRGRYIIQDMVLTAINDGGNGTFLYSYVWQNIGEPFPTEKVAAFSYVPELKWTVAASAYYEDYTTGLAEIRDYILFVVLLSIVVGTIVAYIFALYISAPIKYLTGLSRDAAAGKLNVRVKDNVLSRGGEIGTLANSFKTMIGNLNSYLKDIESSKNELARKNNALKRKEKELLAQNEVLEKFNQIVIGRELKMVELKKKIKDYEKNHAEKSKKA